MNKELNPKTWKFFQEIVVPAVLGNTVWALASFLVGHEFHVASIPKIISLVLITVFFVGDWFRGIGKVNIRTNIRFIIASSIFYSTIVSYAIAASTTTTDSSIGDAALICFFATTAIGHLVGAWKRFEIPKPWALVFVSLILTLALLSKLWWGWPFLAEEHASWVQPIALLFYLLAWVKPWFARAC